MRRDLRLGHPLPGARQDRALRRGEADDNRPRGRWHSPQGRKKRQEPEGTLKICPYIDNRAAIEANEQQLL